MLTLPAVAAVLGINAIFSGAYIAGKIGVGHFPPFLFAALRFAIVAVVLSPFLRFDRRLLDNRAAAAGFCLTMGAGVYGTMYWALYLAGGAAPILIGTQFSTPAAVLLAALFLREKAGKAVWGGIALTMAGVMMVGFDSALLGYPLAFALILASALCYAAANVIARFLRGSDLGLLNLNALMSLAAAPLMALLSLATGENWADALQTADAKAWGTVLYSSLAVSLAGHVGLFALLRRYPLSAVMPFYVFTPIFGVLAAVVLLDETLTSRFVAGAALAIAGVVVVNHVRRE